jgi:hypothetical protein
MFFYLIHIQSELNPTFIEVLIQRDLLIQNPTLKNKKTENNTYLLLIQNNVFFSY